MFASGAGAIKISFQNEYSSQTKEASRLSFKDAQMSVYILIYKSAEISHLSLCFLSMSLSLFSVCVCLSVSFFLSLFLFFLPSPYLYLWLVLPISLFVFVSLLFSFFISPFVSHCLSLSLFLSVHLSLSARRFLSAYLPLSLCLFLSVSLSRCRLFVSLVVSVIVYLSTCLSHYQRDRTSLCVCFCISVYF